MEKNMEELLFNLSCVDETERVYSGDWIYYINSSELSEEGDGAIWKIKKDGTENQRVQRSNTRVVALIGVDTRWIYFVAKTTGESRVSGLRDIMRMISCIEEVENRKMTIRGSLERIMTGRDEDVWSTQLEEMEELSW